MSQSEKSEGSFGTAKKEKKTEKRTIHQDVQSLCPAHTRAHTHTHTHTHTLALAFRLNQANDPVVGAEK